MLCYFYSNPGDLINTIFQRLCTLLIVLYRAFLGLHCMKFTLNKTVIPIVFIGVYVLLWIFPWGYYSTVHLLRDQKDNWGPLVNRVFHWNVKPWQRKAVNSIWLCMSVQSSRDLHFFFFNNSASLWKVSLLSNDLLSLSQSSRLF